MRFKPLFGVVVIGLLAGSFWAQEKQKEEEKPPAAATASTPATPPAPHAFKISPEDAARKNPVKFTETSVGRGKKIFGTQCAMCHGEKGDGKGEMVEEMKISPPDFTKPETLKKRTDGELFAILGVGSETMPGQGSRMPERQKWHLVNFLRFVEGRTPGKPSKDEPEENVILVPQK